MNKIVAIGAGLALLVLLLLFTTTFSVSYHEVAVRTRFGQLTDDSVEREAGLHFKLPFFIDQVETFDTRLQLVESPLETVQIADGQQILVRAFLLWQVDGESASGPVDFFDAYGDIGSAMRSMNDQLASALGVLGQYTFDDLLGPDNSLVQAEAGILASIASSTAGTGVRPRRVGISKIVLPQATTRAVIGRMNATRRTLADAERARGEAESQRVLADANTKADKIRTFATNYAAEIQAEGERVVAELLARMADDEGFAIFLTQLEAMQRIASRNLTLIMSADQSPMHLLDLSTERDAFSGIPIPTDRYMERFRTPVVPAAASPAEMDDLDQVLPFDGPTYHPIFGEEADGE